MKNKNYRYLLSLFIKKNKQNYHNKFFESNWNNTENTPKGIEIAIFLNRAASNVPRALILNDDINQTNP